MFTFGRPLASSTRSTTLHAPLTGAVLETRDVNGRATTGRYDGLGRLLEVRYPDRQGGANPSVAYEYRVQENGLNAVGTYDEAYRALSSTVTLPAVGDLAGLSARSFTTRYAYTPDGQVESVTLPKVTTAGSSGGTTVLGQEQVTTYFDAASMPRWMAGGFGWGTYVAESRFTAYGQRLLTDLGNIYGAVVSYRYDEVTQRLTHVALKREQVTGTDLAVTYAYDPAGNVTGLLDRPTNPALGGAAGVDHQCFTYDGLRRLTSAWTAKDAANCGVPAGEVRP